MVKPKSNIMDHDLQENKSVINTPVTFTILILLFAFRFVPFAFPESRMWGVNHLNFLSDIAVYSYLALAIIIITISSSRLNNPLNNIYNRLSNLMSSKRYLLWGGLSLIAIVIFWLLKIPISILGDGYTIINNIGNELPVVFKWTESGAVGIVYYVSRILPVEGIARGEYAYALLSVVSGGGTLFFFLAIAYEISNDIKGRFFAFCLLLSSGWLLLFFGYAENYPVLWIFITAYIYLAILNLKGRVSIIFPALVLAAGIYLHLLIGFFAVSYLALIFTRGKGKRIFSRYKKFLFIMASLAVAGAMFLFIREYQSSIAFQSHFLPIWSGKPLTPDYAAFSLSHLLDIVNLYTLLIPLWPLLFFVAWYNRKKFNLDPLDIFLLTFSCGGFIFIMIIDPRLGMGRDWDLFALTGLGPALFLIKRFIALEKFQSLYAAIAIIAALLVLPYFMTNLKEASTISYVRYLFDLDGSKSRSGMIMVRDYLFDRGDVETADEINRQVINRHPQFLWSRQSKMFAKQEKYAKAMQYADSVYYYDPHSTDPYNLYGRIFVMQKRYDTALVLLKKSASLAQYDAQTFANLSELYYRLNDKKRMWENVRYAQKLDPRNYIALTGIARAFFNEKRFDSLIEYGHKMIDYYPDSAQGYFTVGLGHLYYKRYDKVIPYYEEYKSRLLTDSEKHQVDSTIAEIRKKMNK